MNKYDDVIQIVGKRFADVWIAPSGSFHGTDIHYYHGITGTSAGYRYPVLESVESEQEVLWKCHSCGKVHRLKDTLECDGCGQPITAKSRFVLE